jgi:hypothetical protein
MIKIKGQDMIKNKRPRLALHTPPLQNAGSQGAK